MDKTKLAILVGLLLALLLLCSMDAEASSNDVYGPLSTDVDGLHLFGAGDTVTTPIIYTRDIQISAPNSDGYPVINLLSMPSVVAEPADASNGFWRTEYYYWTLICNDTEIAIPRTGIYQLTNISGFSSPLILRLTLYVYPVGDAYMTNFSLSGNFTYQFQKTTSVISDNQFLSGIYTGILSWRDSLTNQLSDWRTSLDLKLDEVVEALGKDYDATTGNDSNSELSGSLGSWEEAEGELMADTKIEVSNYDSAGAFSFAPALVSSLSLVTAFSTGFLNASGDFTTAITVMFSLVFVSVLVGLVRFVRR